MANTHQQTPFKFIGERTETAQQHYNNLMEITSNIYIKFKHCITNIAQDCLKIDNTEQQENKLTIEKIREQQQKLTWYKDQIIKSMDATATTLNKTYTQQTKNNHETAHTIAQALYKEKETIKHEHKTWNKIIQIIISLQPQQQTIYQNTTNNTTNTTQQQQTPSHQKRKNYKCIQPLCTNCNSDRPTRHLIQHCKAIRCTNTWCGKLFHNATQCRKQPPTPDNQQQQQTQNQPLCTKCNSDRPTRHLKQHCTATICTNTWCRKPFHNAKQCRTQNNTQENTTDNQQQQQQENTQNQETNNFITIKTPDKINSENLEQNNHKKQKRTQHNKNNTLQQQQQQSPPTNNKGTRTTST